MTLVRTMSADGWDLAEASCRFARDRSTAQVAVRLRNDGDDDVSVSVTWTRETPDTEAGHKIARVWRRVDPDGGRWSIEYGYEGRWWILFGPNGSPWGELLAPVLAGSLIEATEYAVRHGERATGSSAPVNQDRSGTAPNLTGGEGR